MAKPQRILVVIDPTATAQPALERAASLAKLADAQIELLICDYNGTLRESRALGPQAVASARTALIESRLRRLNELAKPLRASGIDATVDARWDFPLVPRNRGQSGRVESGSCGQGHALPLRA